MFDYRVSVDSSNWTGRENNLPQEGGALNAGYTPVDALCNISNQLGKHGLVYNIDWWWESFGTIWTGQTPGYNINLCFAKEEYKLLLPLGEK
mgnify:FL=1|tara:strand:+ start:202 stop:477 length:276 start_codon:yes stop_codon:yes gene_type:complete